MLVEIKNYLSLAKQANLKEISAVVQVDSLIVRDLLQYWIRKGKVRQCDEIPAARGCVNQCPQCVQCSLINNEQYEWLA